MTEETRTKALIKTITQNTVTKMYELPREDHDDFLSFNAYVAIALLRGRFGDAFINGFLAQANKDNAVIELMETNGKPNERRH